MRVVLDSSVIVAAHVARAGVCAELFEDVLQHHDLVLSSHILAEVERVLSVKFLVPAELVERTKAALLRAAVCVEPAEVPPTACRDVDDLPVLGTAVAGSAELLVTVDRDLLDLGSFAEVPIVRPGEFWRLARNSR